MAQLRDLVQGQFLYLKVKCGPNGNPLPVEAEKMNLIYKLYKKQPNKFHSFQSYDLRNRQFILISPELRDDNTWMDHVKSEVGEVPNKMITLVRLRLLYTNNGVAWMSRPFCKKDALDYRVPGCFGVGKRR